MQTIIGLFQTVCIGSTVIHERISCHEALHQASG